MGGIQEGDTLGMGFSRVSKEEKEVQEKVKPERILKAS